MLAEGFYRLMGGFELSPDNIQDAGNDCCQSIEPNPNSQLVNLQFEYLSE